MRRKRQVRPEHDVSHEEVVSRTAFSEGKLRLSAVIPAFECYTCKYVVLVVEERCHQNLEQESPCERIILPVLTVIRGGLICDKDAVCVDKSRSTSKDAILMLSPVRQATISTESILRNATYHLALPPLSL